MIGKETYMKKIISTILIATLIFSLFTFDFSSSAKNNTENIQGFVSDAMELISYQPEIEFNTFSDNEYSDETDLSTCRLIVKADKQPNKLNAVGIASGYKDYHIVQFANTSDTIKALNTYTESDDIESVCVDKTVPALENPIEKSLEQNIDSNPNEHTLNSWAAETTGLYAIKNYVKNNNIQLNEVKVALIGTGVDLDQEFFEGRLERTYFYGSGTPEAAEQDFVNHETSVTSIIIDATPENVKIRNYKVADDGNFSMATVTVAMLQAILDGAQIINCSFLFPIGMTKLNAEALLFADAIRTAYEQNVFVIASSGNDPIASYEPNYALPASSTFVLTISASNIYSYPCNWSSRGEHVAVCAPGESVPAIGLYGYEEANGTSFSAPIVSAVCAMMLSFNPDLKVEDAFDIIRETATPYDECNVGILLYGEGLVDAVGAVGLERPNISVNKQPGKYEEKIVLEATSSGNEDIYYTFDLTYPTPENGILLADAVEIYATEEIFKAVSYNEDGIPSKVYSGLFRSSILADETDFTIDEEGAITSYTGKLHDIIIPETINGITVTDISNSAFNSVEVWGLTLPNTITFLGGLSSDGNNRESFKDNSELIFLDGESVTKVGWSTFDSSRIRFYNLPNLEHIGYRAFYNVSSIDTLFLPKAKIIEQEAFRYAYCTELFLPEVTTIGFASFYNFGAHKLCIPKLANFSEGPNGRTGYLDGINVRTVFDLTELVVIPKQTFRFYNDNGDLIVRLEFSKATALLDLPGNWSSLVIPSTLKSMPEELSEYEMSTYTFYGSSGTYIEQWAKENGAKFIEITPETAVINDLPEYYKSYMGELEADVVGFNRTYQWYSNTTDNNTTGKAIEGATSKTFNPADYPAAAYYYCEVTSKDGDFEEITIRTSACENRSITPDITKVEYVQQEDTHKDFTVTANGRKSMIQFMEADGGTRTYDRYHKNVTITSYNADGEVVNDLSRDLAYEVWNIYSNMSVGNEIKVRGKVSGKWDIGKYKFTIEPYNPIVSMELSSTSGKKGPVPATVVADEKTEKVMFKMPDNTTVTVASKATDENGNKIFTGKAWMNKEGLNEIRILIYRNKVWRQVGTLDYMACIY